MIEVHINSGKRQAMATLCFISGKRCKRLPFRVDDVHRIDQVDQAIGKMIQMVTRQYLNHRRKIITDFSSAKGGYDPRLQLIARIEQKLRDTAGYKTRGTATVVYGLKEELQQLAPGRSSRYNQEDTLFLYELFALCRLIIDKKEETIKSIASI